ncbi:MAG: nucleoside hydrolase [Anaerolineae bacterium]|jgi:purine nucleosidase
MSPRPIILDADIGTDVDDAFALALAARSPELDLRAVSTVYGDVHLRALLARKLLILFGLADVPVAAGCGQPLTPERTPFWGGWEGVPVLAPSEGGKT